MVNHLLHDQLSFIAQELARVAAETTHADLAGPLVEALLTRAARDLRNAATLCAIDEP
jgi:hypothetical protein